MDKHPDCEELLKGCMIAEHKGYPPCDGFCQHKEDQENAYANAMVKKDMAREYSDDGISAWIHGAGDRPSSCFNKDSNNENKRGN